MDRLSEEEIIDKVMMIVRWKVSGDIYTQNELNAIDELLDLYNKEKEKNYYLVNEKERIGKLYYEVNENCIKYEKVIKQIVDYLDIDDETMEQLGIYDVNGIEIMKIIKGELK